MGMLLENHKNLTLSLSWLTGIQQFYYMMMMIIIIIIVQISAFKGSFDGFFKFLLSF